MNGSFKEMVVALAIAAVIFRLWKSIGCLFGTEQDFCRRRNVWFALSATAFLSPNFWLFALVAVPLLMWAGRRDTNPVALYLVLLHVIPPIPINIPAVGIKELFALDNYRLLSFCVLIPAAWRLRKSKDVTRLRGFSIMDYSLLAYGALQLAIYVPPDLPNHTILTDSATNVLRRAFLFYVDVYVLYFVVSRYCCQRRRLVEAIAAFCLASTIMAALAVFETLRHWLLYSNLSMRWAEHAVYGTQYGFYFFRDGFLRAQTSAGHALSLGYLLAIALGFWLYLQSHLTAARLRISVALLLSLGLLASQARGSWIGAVGIYVAFAALGQHPVTRLSKTAGGALLILGALSLTPWSERIANSLPFVGHPTDTASVDYRQRLAERSWELIQQNPFLGDPLVMSKMEDLRQGEGIIDIVNAYAGVTLFYGLIGLVLFLAVMLIGLFRAYRVTRETMQRDPDYAALGACLVACILGTLFMMSTTSLVLGYEKMFYALAGLSSAYAYASRQQERR
jgi:O-antigen ligase